MIVAIVVSVGGLYLSLSRMSAMPGATITGFASSGGGQVNITILNFNSITLNDAQIDLGELHSCLRHGLLCPQQ
ncbi:MAG: hypothetical protein ABIH34_07770 [Nanoarchaeota archaeon]